MPKISGLPGAPSPSFTDIFPDVEPSVGGTTYKATFQQLWNLFKTDGQAVTRVNDSNVTLTLGGFPPKAALTPFSMTMGWTGILPNSRGGTGTSSAFIQGSVVFIGAAGVYSEDNTHFFWDPVDIRLGIGTNNPNTTAHITTPNNTTQSLNLLSEIYADDPTNTAGATFSHVVSSVARTAGVSIGHISSLEPNAGDTSGHTYYGYAADNIGAIGLASKIAYGAGVGWDTLLGGASGNIFFDSYTPNIFSNTGDINFQFDGVSATGNVGIGKNNPATRLDINGTITADDAILTNLTPYAVICGGNSTSLPIQSVESLGSEGDVLTSNGAGFLPTFQAPATSSVSIDGDSGETLTGNSFTFSGGTTGFTFNGFDSTLTLTGTADVTHGGTGTITQFTTGSVVFAGASGIYTQDNANFFWDDTNNRLGVGTTTPGTALTVSGALTIIDGAQNFFGGLVTESGSGIIDYGLNDSRFGSQVTSSPGGFLRFQTTGGVVMQSFVRAATVGSASAGFYITEENNVGLSAGAVATNATDNFAHMTTCGGTPTGVPTTLTGLSPFIFDTTNNQFYIYNSGWKMPSGNFDTSFTPTMGDGTNNFTLSVAKFHYLQIGKLIHFSTHITWTSKGSASGAIQVSLPHTLGAATTLYSFVPGFMDQVTTFPGTGAPLIYGAGGLTYFGLAGFQSGGSPIQLTDIYFANAGTITVTGTYSI